MVRCYKYNDIYLTYVKSINIKMLKEQMQAVYEEH